MKKILYFLILLPLSITAQNLPEITAIQKATNKKNAAVFNNDTMKLDSTYMFKYASETDSTLIHRYYYKYDSYGNEIFSTGYYVDPLNNQWIGDFIRIYKYNSIGEELYKETFYWSREKNNWAGDEKYVHNFDTSQSDKLSYFSSYQWNKADSKWNLLDSMKSVISLSNKNDTIVTVSSTYKWDEQNKIWIESGKQEKYSKNKDFKICNLTWNSSQNKWIYNTRWDYNYNENGKMINLARYNWNEQSNSWNFDYTDTTIYNSSGRVFSNISYHWNTKKNSWEYSYKSENTYDSNGNLLLYIGYQWDTLNNNWIGYNKKEYSFDANNNQITYGYYSWIVKYNKWIYQQREEKEFDSQGNMIRHIVSHSWDESINNWTRKYIYSYKDGLVTECVVCLWNRAKQTWVNSSKYEGYYNESDYTIMSKEFLWDTVSGAWQLRHKTFFYYSKGFPMEKINPQARINEIKCYPNPVTDLLHIEITSKFGSCIIFNIEGKMIASYNLHQDVNKLDMTKLKSGIYILHMETNGEFLNRKILKK